MTQMISRSRMVGAALAAGLTLGVPAMAWAGGAPSGHAYRGPCADDIRSLCPDLDDRDDARRCLHEHADQVSPGCAATMETRRQRHVVVRNACAADITAFCPDAEGGDVRRCLHQHRRELSANCVPTLDALRRHGSETSN